MSSPEHVFPAARQLIAARGKRLLREIPADDVPKVVDSK